MRNRETPQLLLVTAPLSAARGIRRLGARDLQDMSRRLGMRILLDPEAEPDQYEFWRARQMQRVKFIKRPDSQGEPLYDLWIDGELQREALPIDEVVKIISEPDRSPGRIPTPEDGREEMQRR